MLVNCRIYDIDKYVDFANNGTIKEMELGLLDGGEDAEHTGVGFVDISIIILFEADWPFLSEIPLFSVFRA